MFNQFKTQTLDQKINAAAFRMNEDIRTAARELGFSNRSAALQKAIQEALHEISHPTPKKFTLEYGKMTLEANKPYRAHGVVFQIWDPAKLSEKQLRVIRQFVRDIETVSHNDALPWIDVIFMLNRQQISVDTFNKITKLDISVSTFDKRHQHNW